MLNYNHLRYFWFVAREGHLSRSAEKLNISQSALSTQISKLEDRIGHPLFQRSGRKLELTEAGRIAYEYACSIFATGEELMAVLTSENPAVRRRIRVGAQTNLSRNFQIDFLRPVLKQPDADITITSGSLKELFEGLEAQIFDLALVNQIPARDQRSNWTAQVISQQQVGIIGTKSRLEDRNDYRDLLASEPLIIPTDACGYRSSLDSLFVSLDIKPDIFVEVDDMAMMRLLAREDVGLSILPPIVVRDELIRGDLVEACHLPGVNESFIAIRPKRDFPNILVSELFDKGACPSTALGS